MGSCISPVVANIFMEYVEHTAITTFHTPPRLCVRYVDDTFCIMKRSAADEFHQHLNSISSSIKFTVEHEQNNSISFLDVKVTRHKNNSSLATSIFKKRTHTDRYLHFNSHHPKHQKLTVAKTFYNRIDTHISDNSERLQHSKDIKNTLLLNGFPRKYARLQPPRDNSSPQPEYESFTCLPYIRGVSDKIQRILNKIGIKVAMKPYLTIGKYLPSPKDPLK